MGAPPDPKPNPGHALAPYDFVWGQTISGGGVGELATPLTETQIFRTVPIAK